MSAKRYTAEIIEASDWTEMAEAEAALVREGGDVEFLFGAQIYRDRMVRAYRVTTTAALERRTRPGEATSAQP